MNVAVFKSPYDREKTEQIVADVIKIRKGTYKGNVGKWRAHDVTSVLPTKARFFYGDLKDGTVVRVVFDKVLFGRFWRSFVCALNEKYGDVFGLNAELHNHKPAAVLTMENEVRQVYVSQTRSSPSLTGMLLGGFAFGVSGAIIGGMSGKERTVGHTNSYETGNVEAEILWDNGIITKEVISKKSDFYNEILMMHLEE